MDSEEMIIFPGHKSSFTIGSSSVAICLRFLVVMHRSVDLGSHLSIREGGCGAHIVIGRGELLEIDDRGGAAFERRLKKELKGELRGQSDGPKLAEEKRGIISIWQSMDI